MYVKGFFMKYNYKCAIVARKKIKETDSYNCLINMFDINEGHLSGEVPKEFLEFENVKAVEIKNLDLCYFLIGNDLVINDLTSLEVTEEEGRVVIKGKQK